MPWYRLEGKIQTPLSEEDFERGMRTGKFVVYPQHAGFNTLLYYSAVRKMEALRATKEQFIISRNEIMFSVGKRLKHGIETPSLPLPLDNPFMTTLLNSIEDTEKGERVFPYCAATGYNIVHRVFKYPHLFRLSRITNFFLEEWSIAQVRSWTGLTLAALEYYIGLVDIKKMGKSLK